MPINPDSPLARMERALINADNAGDIDAASKLAQEIRRMKQAEFSTPMPIQNGTGGPPKARADDVEQKAVQGMAPDFEERTALQRGLGIQPGGQGGSDFLGDLQQRTALQRRAIGQGATLGFMDELEAAARAGGEKIGSLFGGSEVDFGDRYSEIQAQLQAEQEQFQQEEPGKAIAASLLGGGATGGGILGAPGVAARIGQMGLLGKAGAAAATGAATGAVSGAGTAAPGERLRGAGTGAVLGAATGAALPVVGAGVGRVARGIVGDTAEGAKGRVAGTMRQAMKQEGLDEQQLAQKVREMGPEATVADALGTSGEKLLYQTASTPRGQASKMVDDFLEGRVAGEFGRLKGKIQQLTGNRKQYLQTLDELAEQRRTLSAPLYEEARAQPLQMTSGLKGAVQRLKATGALRKAAKKAELDGDVVDENVLDVKRLDYAKRALDDDIGIAMRAGKRDKAAQLIRIKNDLLDEIDRQVPAYQKARQVFSGVKEIENATEQGAKFLRGEIDVNTKEFAKLSDAQREGFRIGAMRAINQRMGKVKDDASISNLFNTPDMRERMRFVFPNDEAFDDFIKAARAEQRFADVRNIALRGSQTAARQRITEEGIGAAEGAGLAADVATGGLGGLLRGAVGLGRRLPGIGRSSREAEELARALLARGQTPLPQAVGGRILLPGAVAGGQLPQVTGF